MVVTTTPSTPSTSYTISLSTAVGTSTFEGISIGEHLNPSQAASGYNVSEGELGLLSFAGLKSIDQLQNDSLQYDEGILSF